MPVSTVTKEAVPTQLSASVWLQELGRVVTQGQWNIISLTQVHIFPTQKINVENRKNESSIVMEVKVL